MVAYAHGAQSRAICDRCGFEVPYSDLREEWNGLRTCSTYNCWEPKQPQLEPRSVVDAEILRTPRSGSNEAEAATIRAFRGMSLIARIGEGTVTVA